MVYASVEEYWAKNTFLTYSSIDWEVVRDRATTQSTFCTRIHARYQVDELWEYPAEGQDSLEHISVHRVERLTEIYTGSQQPRAEVTQEIVEDTECQDTIHGRLLGCETELLMALVSKQLLADLVENNSCQELAWHREEATHCTCYTPGCHPFPSRSERQRLVSSRSG